MGIEEFLLDCAKNKGKAEGKAERNSKFTKNLLLSTDFSVKRIAELVGVSETFVKKVKATLHETE